MERLDDLFAPYSVLKTCRLAALAGVLVNLGRDALGIHDANTLYNALLFTIGVTAWAAIWLASRASPGDVLQAFSWVGGTSFAFMIFHDAVNGDVWLHAYLLYLFGIVLLSIHAGPVAAKRFSVYAGAIGFIAGIFYANADYAVWTVVSVLFTLGLGLYIAPRLHTHDEIESIVRVCRDAERRRAAKER